MRIIYKVVCSGTRTHTSAHAHSCLSYSLTYMHMCVHLLSCRQQLVLLLPALLVCRGTRRLSVSPPSDVLVLDCSLIRSGPVHICYQMSLLRIARGLKKFCHLPHAVLNYFPHSVSFLVCGSQCLGMCTSHLCLCPTSLPQQEECMVTSCIL